MDGLEPYSFNRHPQYPRSTRTRHVYSCGPDEELDDEEELEQENNNVDDDNDDDPDVYYRRVKESKRFERYPKRQKLSTSAPSFQYTPNHRDSFKTAYDWSQQEIYVLLEVWGNRFLQLGRRSLRDEDWVDVAEKVSDALKIVKNEAQCRHMIDGLKRKFKKEKSKAERMGLNSSKWVYLDRSNGFDEMRDSPTESEMEEEEDGEEADGESRVKAEVHDEHSMRMLADSVQKFGKIYEKIESSKREHMRELENMRMDFQKELEVQKKQILERAQAEIAKLKEEDDDEDETDDEDQDYENSMQDISE
ncbi:Sulfate transporter 3,5 isoform 1 [Hibiscus syriacus]|uniref:Sulfate transporter 3,5 isoform 1 n=1 Tax=Hibiscus syriacus TaxID=106335 RepID=A0A6A3B7L7_HIBSY|nr:Sulfate transporter 3,5 isoform 1 [Hibiscus syriacus]